ncbi:alpha/beta fold hydrolase [Kitasatospora sp. A2-31]|uniref:alpha/beta fold hydrolase n=1 Tax=Kitasatospora sp. A2-31 TaxID=2916414 RepID=UPI001EEAF8EC|nr:alpha/beta hydrolase [Kitasatospora sp. A2-31]MCG6494545.1 alpha/beta hydrolase [Kitasatospora sp. A2-31]
MPAVTVDTARIPYRIVGDGPETLLLVHGTGPGSGMWDHLLDGFTDRYTVLLPELSGSETAEDDGGELTVDTLAAQVNAVIEDAGRGPVHLVGFSLGAVVATAAAARRPEQVRRLVAAAGWINADDEYLRNMMTVWLAIADDPAAFGRYATLTAFSRGFLNRIGREAVEANAAFMQPTPGTLRHIALDLSLDITDLLPRVQAPTLVIGCSQDATIPVENTRRLHAAIAGSEYAEFDTGHVVVFEQAEAFTSTVRDFLAAA